MELTENETRQILKALESLGKEYDKVDENEFTEEKTVNIEVGESEMKIILDALNYYVKQEDLPKDILLQTERIRNGISRICKCFS